MVRAEYSPYTLKFAFVAHTSRETFTEKRTYLLRVYDPDIPGIEGRGEVAVFPSLQPSFVDFGTFESTLAEVCANIEQHINGLPLPQNSAIRFGVESALGDMAHGGTVFGPGAVDAVSEGIRINGLVWMNDKATMERQIGEKLDEGFRCLKLKIGAIDFDHEIDLISSVRRCFSPERLEIRVDANGAFRPDNVMARLEALSRFDLHSIEQPLPRDSVAMADVCRRSPVPVALDEDMIERWWTVEQMTDRLNKLSPAYIVLKPSLVGGFDMADRWVEAARATGTGWWATSALESNIGLSAIAQWLGTHPDNLDIPHGLGTGQIYTNNIDAPIERRGERIFLTL